LSESLKKQHQHDSILLARIPDLGLLAVALGKKTRFSNIMIPVLPETWPFDE